MQKIEPLGIELRCQHDDPGDVAPGMSEAFGKAGHDRIDTDKRADDRRRPRLLAKRTDCCTGNRQDDIGLCPRKLTGKCRQLFRGSEPCFDNEVSAFDKAEPGKLWKRRGTYSLERAGARRQEAQAIHSLISVRECSYEGHYQDR